MSDDQELDAGGKQCRWRTPVERLPAGCADQEAPNQHDGAVSKSGPLVRFVKGIIVRMERVQLSPSKHASVLSLLPAAQASPYPGRQPPVDCVPLAFEDLLVQ